MTEPNQTKYALLSRNGICREYALFWSRFYSDFTQINEIWLRLYSDNWAKKWWVKPLLVINWGQNLPSRYFMSSLNRLRGTARRWRRCSSRKTSIQTSSTCSTNLLPSGCEEPPYIFVAFNLQTFFDLRIHLPLLLYLSEWGTWRISVSLAKLQ